MGQVSNLKLCNRIFELVKLENSSYDLEFPENKDLKIGRIVDSWIKERIGKLIIFSETNARILVDHRKEETFYLLKNSTLILTFEIKNNDIVLADKNDKLFVKLNEPFKNIFTERSSEEWDKLGRMFKFKNWTPEYTRLEKYKLAYSGDKNLSVLDYNQVYILSKRDLEVKVIFKGQEYYTARNISSKLSKRDITLEELCHLVRHNLIGIGSGVLIKRLTEKPSDYGLNISGINYDEHSSELGIGEVYDVKEDYDASIMAKALTFKLPSYIKGMKLLCEFPKIQVPYCYEEGIFYTDLGVTNFLGIIE